MKSKLKLSAKVRKVVEGESVKKPEVQVDYLIMTPKIERILVEGFKLWCRMNADDLESAFASLRRLCKGEPD